MITRTVSHDGEALTYVLRPNGSLAWRTAKWGCAGMMLLSATVAGWFALRGAWLVLPFAGAEMVLLATALYLACRWSRHAEVIRVEHDALVLQQGRARPEQEHRFQRAWARVVLIRDPRGWYPSRLLLRSHGRSVEVGARLVEEERLELAGELARLTGAAAPAVPAPWRPVTPARTRSVAT